MRPRLVLLALGLAVIVALLAIPGIQAFMGQVGLMRPVEDEALHGRAGRAYRRAVAIEPRLRTVQQALQAAWRGRLNPSSFRDDDGNGLYTYLQLLPDLPAGDGWANAGATGGASVSDGRDESDRHGGPPLQETREPEMAGGDRSESGGLAARVGALAGGSPVRLYTGRQYELVFDAYRSVGVPDRAAAVIADQGLGYAMIYRPVLRRLAGGLIVQGRAWREAGRAEDAVAAWAAAARLLLDAAEESPRPGLALLAAEYVPVALREIAGAASEAGLPPEAVERGLAEAVRVEALRDRWHEASPGEALNLLPHNGDIVVARAAHDRMMGSMLASGYVMAAWAALGVVCLVVCPFALSAWQTGMSPRWRWEGHGRWVATGIVIGPLVVVVGMCLLVKLPLAWVFSSQSMVGLASPVLLAPVMVGLAAWAATILPEGYERLRFRWTVVGAMAAGAVVVLLGVMLLPAHAAPGRPPAAVQTLRRVGLAIGAISLVLVAVWMVWGQLRRRRLRLRPGPRSAAVLGVAAWAWLATAVLGLVVLGFNARNDRLHEPAFIRASADPLSDRLGPSWYDEYLRPAGEYLSGVQRR